MYSEPLKQFPVRFVYEFRVYRHVTLSMMSITSLNDVMQLAVDPGPWMQSASLYNRELAVELSFDANLY